ncbi:MFS transporter [Nonomuraea sp. NPDC059194]|uniref:MFS transporter n=1 Tax=Nonomuraea sp. NPDC059194 TaxID=3346764 RepID=UPI00369D1941
MNRLIVAASAPLLVLMNYTVPMVTLPDTAKALGAGPTGPVWILSAIALGLSSLLLVAGSLADDYGRKRTLVAGTAVLAGASVVAAIAPTVPVFVGARLVQGAAGAAMLAASLGIVGHAFASGAARVRATAVYGAMMGLGTAVGPLLSGVLAVLTSWRAVYWVVAVAALALMVAAACTLEESRAAVTKEESRASKPLEGSRVAVAREVSRAANARDESGVASAREGSGVASTRVEPGTGGRRRVDLPGVVLLTLGIAALVAGVTEGRMGWTRPIVAIAFAASVFLLAAFAVVERRRREPLLDLALFGRPRFLVATGGALVVGAAVIGLLSYLPSVLQAAHGMSALTTALLFATWSGMSVVSSLAAARVRLGAGSRLSLGLLLSAVGFAGLLGVVTHFSLPLTITGLVVSGAGSGLINSSLTHLAIESVPRHRVSMGSGANNTARYVGSSLGAAAMAALIGALGLETGVLVTVIACIVLLLGTAGAVQAHLLAVPAPFHRAPLPGPRV